MKERQLRKIIREEIKNLKELNRSDWNQINNITKDIIRNFKKITRYNIMDMIDTRGMLDQDAIDKTLPDIKKYVMQKYNVDIINDFGSEILYQLDDEIIDYAS